MKKTLTKIILIILFIIILIGIPVGCFYVYRRFNWKFGYGPMVEKVMQEHLEEHHETEQKED